MSKVEMLNPVDHLRLRVPHGPTRITPIDHRQKPEIVVHQIVEELATRQGQQEGMEYFLWYPEPYHGGWKPLLEGVDAVVQEHVDHAFYVASRTDASRTIDNITVLHYDSPQLPSVFRPLLPVAWMADVAVTNFARYGDGARFLERDSNGREHWVFQQRTGNYYQTSRLLFRTKR